MFKPYHFLSMFEFVRQRKYGETGVQRLPQNRFAELEKQGIKLDVW